MEQRCLICNKVLTEEEFEECGNYCYEHNEMLEEEYFQSMRNN